MINIGNAGKGAPCALGLIYDFGSWCYAPGLD